LPYDIHVEELDKCEVNYHPLDQPTALINCLCSFYDDLPSPESFCPYSSLKVEFTLCLTSTKDLLSNADKTIRILQRPKHRFELILHDECSFLDLCKDLLFWSDLDPL
jgi:hypothetical protein